MFTAGVSSVGADRIRYTVYNSDPTHVGTYICQIYVFHTLSWETSSTKQFKITIQPDPCDLPCSDAVLQDYVNDIPAVILDLGAAPVIGTFSEFTDSVSS